MLIPVPPKDCFDVEPGRYKAKCVEVRDQDIPTCKGIVKGQRIVWELDIPGAANLRYLVGKNYEPTLAKGSVLRTDLRSWFGHDIKGRQFDTVTLKGKEALITVHDIVNEVYLRLNPHKRIHLLWCDVLQGWSSKPSGFSSAGRLSARLNLVEPGQIGRADGGA
jgi:hypothetical protein